MNKKQKWLIIGIELVLIISLVRGVIRSRRTRMRVSELKKIQKQLWEKRIELLSRLDYVQSNEYLERLAREELGLSKEGETILIVEQGDKVDSETKQVKQGEDKVWWEKLWLEIKQWFGR